MPLIVALEKVGLFPGATGWVDAALAIDLQRAWRLEQRGYRVWTQTIPSTITPKNRLLLGRPWSSHNEERRTKN